jgi:hypothetical protein
MAVGSGLFIDYYGDLQNRGSNRKAWYLYPLEEGGRDDPYFYTLRRALFTYGEYFILINTIIPISLVVSLEFVKLIQTPFIANDVTMFDFESMKQT